MKKVKAREKQFLVNRQKKLMRQRMRKNRSKRNHVSAGGTPRYMNFDTAAVNRILEANGFGKGRGEAILNYNGISAKPKQQAIDRVTISVPKTLSISEDSDAVILFLRDCYDLIVNNNISRITFDHTNCAMLGLSASTFMDVVVITAKSISESRAHYHGNRDSLILDGIMNTNSEISKILQASGLPKHIGANMHGEFIEKDEISPLDVIYGRARRNTGQSAINATKLTEYFQKCLNKEGMTLSPDGCSFFTDLFGEVLTNCEIHGGKDSSWYTQGIYLKKEYGGEMQLLFMNIGDTIYEGLLKQCSQETTERINHLLNRHKKYINQSWTEEMICTLFALQDGISRFRERNKDGCETRGNGTIVMINAFQAIGARSEERTPRMTIVSGNTRIVFDDKYRLKTELFDDCILGKGEKEIIAFNKDNNIYKPADSKNVTRCKMRFPGTVISLKFVLNRDYVEKIKRGGMDGK